VTGYTYLWEFIVESEHADEFERHYGPQGSWVQLFRRAPGYTETLLLRDSTNPQRFITIDRWKNGEAYRKFRSEFSQEYEALDSRCERLTIQETLIGEFSEPTV
jgi:heme-degrading monooxygenase HmoA